MSRPRPNMSITLPRNFTYHSPDFSEPRTPDNQDSEVKLPPPPRHATCRFPRARPNLDIFMRSGNPSVALNSEDVPIPSIEFQPEPFQSLRPPLRQIATEPSSDGFLPSVSNQTFSSPKTPPRQIHASEIGPEPSSQWALRASSLGMNTTRPSSACSGISDSSISSEESFELHSSFGGSCTSPESDVTDPFIPSIRIKRVLQSSPTKAGPALYRVRNLRPKTEWTAAMDEHLWNTYQMYLQDPTVTPFKMIPGSIPPLGVSSRVAREARRTWSKIKRASHPPTHVVQPLRDVHNEAHAVKNETPTTVTPIQSGSTTPVADFPEPVRGAWPRSESATRRRLKELCKKKSSIPIHYQRLLASRSPSPFLDPSSHRRARLSRSSSSMSSFSGATRDLGVALVSSSATSVLAQLTTGDSPPASDEWFNLPVQASSSQSTVSNSSDTGLGIDVEDVKNIPRLGSPFAHKNWSKTWGPSHSRQNPRPKTPVNHETMHVTGPRLMSPVRLDPFSNVQKRRAQHPLEDELSPGGTDLQTQTNLQDLFAKGSTKDISQRKIRLRNRGATMGAVGGSDQLNRLFHPPTPGKMDMSPLVQPSSGFLDAPMIDAPKRLGSPFEHEGSQSSKRTGNSRHTPSISDPFVGESSASRLTLPSINQALDTNHSGSSGLSHPLNDMEPGLTDAERMNRQIKNYFASRS